MLNYMIKRLALLPPLILGLSFLSFALINLSPSDPAEVALRINEIVPTEEAVAGMRLELGLDKPFMARYLNWLGQSLKLDFGTSYATRRPVTEDLLPAIAPTLQLALAALALIAVFSLLMGVSCAVWEGRWPDYLGRAFIFLSTAMPNYWIGLLLMWLFAARLGWLPLGGLSEKGSLILPSISLALAYIGTYTRLIRTSMLSNLRSGYAVYAAMRGIKKTVIIWRHVLPNSIQSSITALGMSIPKLIAGTVVVENIFAWPGLGRLCVKAILDRDLPMLQIYILMMGLLFVLFNFMADLVQLRLDPRLRLGRAE